MFSQSYKKLGFITTLNFLKQKKIDIETELRQ